MRKVLNLCFVVFAFCIGSSSCGSFQADTNISVDDNVEGGSGYTQNGQGIVYDMDRKKITFDLQEDIIKDFTEYEKLKYPLLGKLEEEDVYLYEDKGKGGVLVKGEYVQYLELGENGFFTHRGVLPELHSGDFDGDSKNEIAVVLYVGSGTGISFEELYVLDEDEAYKEMYTVYPLSNEEYSSQLEESLTYSLNDDNHVTMSIGSSEYDLNIIEDFTGLSSGVISYFFIEGNDIYLYSLLGANRLGMNEPIYEGMCWLKAKVNFSKEGFELANIVYDENIEHNPFTEKKVNQIN